jgi:hypothetical protein
LLFSHLRTGREYSLRSEMGVIGRRDPASLLGYNPKYVHGCRHQPQRHLLECETAYSWYALPSRSW